MSRITTSSLAYMKRRMPRSISGATITDTSSAEPSRTAYDSDGGMPLASSAPVIDAAA